MFWQGLLLGFLQDYCAGWAEGYKLFSEETKYFINVIRKNNKEQLFHRIRQMDLPKAKYKEVW